LIKRYHENQINFSKKVYINEELFEEGVPTPLLGVAPKALLLR